MWAYNDAAWGKLMGDYKPGELMAEWVKNIPMGRAGSGEDVAGLVSFLASTTQPTSPARRSMSMAACSCLEQAVHAVSNALPGRRCEASATGECLSNFALRTALCVAQDECWYI